MNCDGAIDINGKGMILRGKYFPNIDDLPPEKEDVVYYFKYIDIDDLTEYSPLYLTIISNKSRGLEYFTEVYNAVKDCCNVELDENLLMLKIYRKDDRDYRYRYILNIYPEVKLILENTPTE